LVIVAWADGAIDKKEKSAILQAATSMGVPTDGPGYALLQSWLEHKPPAKLLHAWEAYVAALAADLSPEQREDMKTDVVERARRVAEAAGGFLGIGPKTSASEEEALQRLARAFGGTLS
jgi:tellurite resistance protein